MTQQPPNNPNQSQGTPSFWGNMQPPPQWQEPQKVDQPFNPQFPSGIYPPVPQPGQFTQQSFSQGQYLPQQAYSQQLPQGYPQQPLQQPLMPPPTPPKKKPWYKKPWGVTLIILLSLGICGGISNAFSAGSNNGTATTTDNVSQAATTVPTQAVRAVKPTAIPTQKPRPTPTSKPTQSPTQIEAAYKSNATDTTVSDVDKQGNVYKGKDIHFTGRIVNFVKDDSGTTAGANVDDPNDSTTSVIQITLPIGADLSRLNQGDSVEVWGNDGGTVSGTNGFGATIQEVVVVSLYMTDQTTGYQS